MLTRQAASGSAQRKRSFAERIGKTTFGPPLSPEQLAEIETPYEPPKAADLYGPFANRIAAIPGSRLGGWLRGQRIARATQRVTTPVMPTRRPVVRSRERRDSGRRRTSSRAGPDSEEPEPGDDPGDIGICTGPPPELLELTEEPVP